ncbi:unnamed protein product, partial [Porites lobata]
GYSAGAEATKYIHAMAQIFDDDGTDGILLVDCNIQITCREMSISSTRTEFFEIVLLWRGRDLIPGRGNTGWNQLMKRSTVFSFQFILVRRNRSLMSCKNYSKGGLGIPDPKAQASQQYVASKLITASCSS